jgi:hypothetical protein
MKEFILKVQKIIKDHKLKPITVSQVLKHVDRRPVSEDTEKKNIRAALKQMGYIPNLQNEYVLDPQNEAAKDEQPRQEDDEPVAGSSGTCKMVDEIIQLMPSIDRRMALSALRDAKYDVNDESSSWIKFQIHQIQLWLSSIPMSRIQMISPRK